MKIKNVLTKGLTACSLFASALAFSSCSIEDIKNEIKETVQETIEASEKLASAKANAINELNDYYAVAVENIDNKESVLKIKTDAIENINNASSVEEVDGILKTAEDDIDAEVLSIRTAQGMASAKTTAIEEIEEYAMLSLLSKNATDDGSVQTVVENGSARILLTNTIPEIDSIVLDIKTEIDKAILKLTSNGNIEDEGNKDTVDTTNDVVYEDFQVHFMMLGNDKAGDSVYIKAGETDVLIDAGSRQASVDTTKAYINQYCTDGSLEYVIATHGDQDHIDGFTDTTSRKGIFSSYECKNIIDFEYTTKTTSTYNKYVTLRDTEVENGANHYFASECWNNENGAKRKYQLSENVTMEILYNKYYFEKSSDENNHSVSLMFTYTKNNISKYFMFTGDLEKEGEESMAEYYDGSTIDKTLPQVDLFKAGHHGSKTSSNDCLLDLIQPKMCVVSCCCGTNEYTPILANQFPTQAFIDRIAKWTDAVYVTSIFETYTIETKQEGQSLAGIEVGDEYVDTEGFKPMNGNIIVSTGLNDNNEVDIGLKCSNNSTKLKDTEWFNMKVILNGEEVNIRTCPNEWK